MKSLVSLFSGIGGLDEGLHQAGFSPLFCAELDKNAHATLQEWCKRRHVSPVMERDINAVDPQALMSHLGLKAGELDLLAGGPPCQAFSLIGQRKSMDDHRGLLLFKMIDFANVFRPKAVMIEQVKGLLSAKGHDGKPGSALKQLVSELIHIGYGVSYQVLRAADFGVPQLRDRVFIIAIQSQTPFVFPKQSHCPAVQLKQQGDLFEPLQPYLTLADVIADLPTPVSKNMAAAIPNHVDITPARDQYRINGVPEGECLARQMHLPAEQRQRLNPEKDTTKFRRLSWNLPALTLRGGEAFYHPSENRYLTPREYLRIHGFSDDHILHGPIRGRSGNVRDLDQHRLVANAVPPPLAKAVGSAIYRQLFHPRG